MFKHSSFKFLHPLPLKGVHLLPFLRPARHQGNNHLHRGLYAGYSREDPKLLTTDEDYRFAIEQTNIEAADIKKALDAITLNFEEWIVKREEEKNESAI